MLRTLVENEGDGADVTINKYFPEKCTPQSLFIKK